MLIHFGVCAVPSTQIQILMLRLYIGKIETPEKTLESPLDCKEIQAVHPKGDQSWVSFGRTDAEVETPILWPPHVKS